MIRKTIYTLLVLLMIGHSPLLAQNLLQYIPSDATMVMSIKPASINTKVDINALKQLEFCKEIMDDIAQKTNAEEAGVINDALNNPSQYGMDFNSKSFFFIKASEEVTFYSYLFRLTDADVFSDFFKNKLSNAEQGLRIENINGMTIASMGENTISWNDQVAIFTNATIQREYPEFDWEKYEEEYGEEEEEDVIIEEENPTEEEVIEEEKLNVKPGEEEEKMEDKEEYDEEGEEDYEEEYDEEYGMTGGESDEEYAARKALALNDFSKKLFTIPADSSIQSQPKFLTHLQKQNDASLWIDYQYISQMGMEDLAKNDPTMQVFFNAYKGLYTDAYLSMYMDFDPGMIHIKTDMEMNAEWMNYIRSTVDTKLNKKFYKYLKGDNLLGYMFFNYNVKNIFKGGKDLMLPALEAIPMAGPMVDDALGILDIIIDEEAIYEFFKGDFCLAFTGMRTFENMVTTYEFDEEFNAIEKEELRKKTLPEFVLMMSYGNEENLKKFFRLGEKAGGLEKKGLYYEIPAAASQGMNMYAAFHNGILFFTNDTDLVETHLTSGFPGKRRIAKKHRKMMKANAQVMFWDVPKSLNSASELGIPFGLSGDQMVNVSKQSLESIIIKAPKKFGTSYGADMSFRFANKEMNAMEQLFHFINEIYLVEKGNKSM